MIQEGDRIIQMLLYNSHDSDMTYQRPDKTTYVCQIRKDKPNTFFIPQTQLELSLNLPNTYSKPPISTDAPHINILKKYYGENWKPIPDPNLQPH
tara:strand:+ start:60 stop:344 length:285 start_codon:yes stop_codon:yes gene_type:complete